MKNIITKKQIDTEIKSVMKEVIKEFVEQREGEIKESIFKKLDID